MKKLKITTILLLVAVVMITATSCNFPGLGGGTKQPLASPVVTLNGNVANWVAIPNAIAYEISIDGVTGQLTKDRLSYTLLDGQAFQVRALGDTANYLDSPWSNVVTYNETIAPHTCQNVCSTCGKCTNQSCEESVCQDKCDGHNAYQHTCQNVCSTCGKCTNQTCQETVCSNKCSGHVVEQQYTKISTLMGVNSASCTIKGIVIARNAQSFVVQDDTGMVLVYLGSGWDKSVNVGDEVTVKGTTSIYAKATQFGKESVVTVLSTGNAVTHPTPVVLTGADFSASSLTIKYVKVQGVVSISGNYVNFTFPNSNGLTGSVSYPEEDWSAYHGKTVDMVGYVTGVNSGNYLNICVVSYQVKDDTDAHVCQNVCPTCGKCLDSSCAESVCASKCACNSNEKIINIFSINDNHGDFFQNSFGMDLIASGINANSGDYNIKIANGDLLQGTYVSSSQRGLPMLDALNAMQFDCFVLGNHEFDWGLDVIAKYKDGDLTNGEANFPFLGANIIERATGKRPSWIDPYTIVEVGGVKVGIIGLIGEYQESSILATYSDPYNFVNGDQLVKNYAEELRVDKGCDIVIVAVHDYDTSFTPTLQKWADYSGNSNVDAIFCGHSHQYINDVYTGADGDTVPVLQNMGNGETFAQLKLTLDNANQITKKTGMVHNTSSYTSDGALADVIAKHMDVIEAGNEVIATTATNLSRSKLGSYACQSMKDRFDADIAIINTGGVRNTIEAGQITQADVFQVFPFENQVILCQLSGSKLQAYLSANSSNIYYTSLSIDTSQTYTVAVIDYVFYGAYFDDYRPQTYTNTQVIMRELMIQFVDNLN